MRINDHRPCGGCYFFVFERKGRWGRAWICRKHDKRTVYSGTCESWEPYYPPEEGIQMTIGGLDDNILFKNFLFEHFGQMKYVELADDFLLWMKQKGLVEEEAEE